MSKENTVIQAGEPNNEIGFFDKAWQLTKASAKPIGIAAAVVGAAYVGYQAGIASTQEAPSASV